MAYDFQIYPRRKLAVVYFDGVVRAEDISEAMAALFLDARWSSHYDVLWDCRDIRELHLAPADVAEIAQHTGQLSRHMGKGKAAVVTRRHLDFSNALLLSLKRRSHPARQVRIFESLAEADQWLELDRTLADLTRR